MTDRFHISTPLPELVELCIGDLLDPQRIVVDNPGGQTLELRAPAHQLPVVAHWLARLAGQTWNLAGLAPQTTRRLTAAELAEAPPESFPASVWVRFGGSLLPEIAGLRVIHPDGSTVTIDSIEIHADAVVDVVLQRAVKADVSRLLTLEQLRDLPLEERTAEYERRLSAGEISANDVRRNENMNLAPEAPHG